MFAQLPEDPTEGQVEIAVATLKLLADRTRLRILWALLHGEHSVNELASHLSAHPPAVSQHLAKLRAGRLVRVRREGNRMFYVADDVHVGQLVEEALFHADHIDTTHPDHDRTRPSDGQAGRREPAGARTR